MEEMVATWKNGGPNGGDVFGGDARLEIERAIYGQAGGPMEGPSREMVVKQLNGTLAWKKHLLGLNNHDAEARLHVGVLEQVGDQTRCFFWGGGTILGEATDLDTISLGF